MKAVSFTFLVSMSLTLRMTERHWSLCDSDKVTVHALRCRKVPSSRYMWPLNAKHNTSMVGRALPAWLWHRFGMLSAACHTEGAANASCSIFVGSMSSTLCLLTEMRGGTFS